jgi:hypothetical protein
MQIMLHLAVPGMAFLIQRSLKKVVVVLEQNLDSLSSIEGIGSEGKPMCCDITYTEGQT